MPDETFQLKIQPTTWFAFEVADKDIASFALSGHTVCPGFDVNDLELANRQALTFKYPTLSKFISQFSFEVSK